MASLANRLTINATELSVFIARQHTDARCWYRNRVCPSRSGIPTKQLNISSWFLHHTVRTTIIVVLGVSNIFAKFNKCSGAKYMCGTTR